MASRAESDEHYVLDMCDQILGQKALRQHRFDWLRGDFSEKRQSYSYLPVDGFWSELGLVVEFAERQHTESVAIFDRRDTVSGVTRGVQRRIYDERRITMVPAHGLKLVVIPASVFELRRGKIIRESARDIDAVRSALRAAGIISS